MAVVKKVTKQKAKAAAAKSKAHTGRNRTPKQRAAQKIIENLKSLDEAQAFVQTDSASGMTLENILIRDISAADKGADIVFGKTYYDQLRQLFMATD